MRERKRGAAELRVAPQVRAATDITGFGLLGNAYEMAAASGVALHLIAEQLPLMPQALELAEPKMIPGGANANREFASGVTDIRSKIDKHIKNSYLKRVDAPVGVNP